MAAPQARIPIQVLMQPVHRVSNGYIDFPVVELNKDIISARFPQFHPAHHKIPALQDGNDFAE
jgi:hypothetical protein